MAEDGYVQVRIDWEPDEQKGAFANHLVVSFDGVMYTLRFYQVLPPALPVLNEQALSAIKSVPGRHVTTLVVAKDTLPGIVGALQELMGRQDGEEGGPAHDN